MGQWERKCVLGIGEKLEIGVGETHQWNKEQEEEQILGWQREWNKDLAGYEPISLEPGTESPDLPLFSPTPITFICICI